MAGPPRAAHAFALAIALVLAALTAAACSASPRPRAAAAAPAAAPRGSAEVDAPATDPAPGPEEDEDLGELLPEEVPEEDLCPPEMALVGERTCIDRYEASLVEVKEDGTEVPHPHYAVVDGRHVRAVSIPGVFPQAFISEVQAADACAASGKRLCTLEEWRTACMGQAQTKFPYGDTRQPGACHDRGRSAVAAVFGAKALVAAAVPPPRAQAAKGRGPAKPGARQAHLTKKRAATTARPRARSKPAAPRAPTKATAKATPKKGGKTSPRKLPTRRIQGRASVRPAAVEASVWTKLNDPALGQVEGALARTGEHPDCESGEGVFDMVGNVHEWVAGDPAAPHGTFAGGYYLDVTQNGDGCLYRTVAHAHDYHDYSTGFRCCADARAERP